MRVRCGGRCIESKGSTQIIAGYHREYSDMFRLEDENQSERWLLKRNRDLQQAQTDVAAYGELLKSEKLILDTLCQDFQSFFYLDFEKGVVSVTKANDETRLFLDEGVAVGSFDVYSEKLRACFDHYVDRSSAPDFVQVLDPDRLRERLLREGKLLYRFCAVRSSGKQRHLEVFAALTDEAGEGGVVGFRVIDDIIAQEERKKVELRRVNAQLKEQLYTIGGLSNAYFAVYWVDVRANTCKAIKTVPFFDEVTSGCLTTDDVARVFVDSCVQPEGRAKMRVFVDQSRIGLLFDGADAAVEEFHGMIDPWEWCRASWIVAARNDDGAVKAFSSPSRTYRPSWPSKSSGNASICCSTSRHASSAACRGNAPRSG